MVYEIEKTNKVAYIASAERFGIEKGKLEGEVAILLRQIERKYGPQALVASRKRVEQADSNTLLEWAERVLTAETAEDVFH